MLPHDLRQAWRSLRQRPWLSVAAIICLALGIGANTAAFSLAISVLARPMPGIADPGRLVAIHRTMRTVCCSENSFPLYRDISEGTEVFSGVEAHFPLLSMTLGGQDEPETVWGQLVTSNYFSVLGVRPALGSFFDERLGGIAGGYPFAIISRSLWQRRFGSDPSIAGRQIVLNKGAFTVLGVAPTGFRGPDLGVASDVWVPVSMVAQVMPQHPSLEDRSAPWLMIYARLKSGVDVRQAQTSLEVLARRMEAANPGTDRDRGLLAEPARSFHPGYRGAVIDVVALTMGAVALLLLVACANVANLLLARATSRRRETAIRSALGASRGRLLRESLAESLCLALAGGTLGLFLSIFLTMLAGAFSLPTSVPLSLDVPLDVRVLLFSMGLSVLTGLAFGAAPALGSARHALVAGLRDAAAAGRDRPFGVRNLLVLGQVAASVLLLIVTGLFLRSLLHASAVDPGFRIDRLVLLEIDPRLAADPERLMDRLRERISSLPGVDSATYSDIVPLGFAARATNLHVPGSPGTAPLTVRADSFLVGPRYFETMGIPILRGRTVGGTSEGGEAVAVINRTAAKQLWQDADPVGRSLRRDGIVYRVLGVAADARSRTIGEPQRPCVYFSFAGNHGRDATPFGLVLLVRTSGDPAPMAGVIRREIREAEPRLAVSNVRTMERQLANALVVPRAGAISFGAFGLTGIILTAVGLYGVVAFSASRRTREFGIRSALGARRADIVRVVLAGALVPAVTGVAIGTAAAFASTRVLSKLLYGISSTDPLTFALVPATVLLLTLAAAYIPARRAASLDPLEAIRIE